MKEDFFFGFITFHLFFHAVMEGYVATALDKLFGTQFVNGYSDAIRIACALLVPDETPQTGVADRTINGLVINQVDNVALPKVFFVAPYTVQEVQAMTLWDHLENTYAYPFVKHLVQAILLMVSGHSINEYLKYRSVNHMQREVKVFFCFLTSCHRCFSRINFSRCWRCCT